MEQYMSIQSMPPAERPLERGLSLGVQALSNIELLALIIRTGTREQSALTLAEEIITLCPGGLYDLGTLQNEDLKKIRGMGDAKAMAVRAAAELGKRIAASRQPERAAAGSPQETADLFMERLRFEKKEHFICVCVNQKCEMLGWEEVSVGELSSAPVHPREAFLKAVRMSAAGVIFLHNHPTGDPEPSHADFQVTERLVQCGRLLGIRVLDHIILGDGVFQSMTDLGVIPQDFYEGERTGEDGEADSINKRGLQ